MNTRPLLVLTVVAVLEIVPTMSYNVNVRPSVYNPLELVRFKAEHITKDTKRLSLILSVSLCLSVSVSVSFSLSDEYWLIRLAGGKLNISRAGVTRPTKG